MSTKDNTGVCECYDYIINKIIYGNSDKANKLKKEYLENKKNIK